VVHRILTAICLTIMVPLLSTKAHSCSVTGIVSNVEMVKVADAIVRARAVEYAQPPSDPSIVTTGVPDSRVRFKVIETLSGQNMKELVLPGYLVSTDDFNDRAAPYTFVRPGGRAGSCFANSYRRDAQYLLFLKKTAQGDLTVNWAALAPVNEQLHSAEDPWLTWVRQQADKLKSTSRQ
jgi:hypothetical protein